MFQLLQTEVCQCGKLKQTGKACKTCGFIMLEQPAEFYRPQRFAENLPKAVAKALPGEDEIERARR